MNSAILWLSSKVIFEYKPRSISELEKLTHRKKSNFSRTLKTLEKYGIVELPKEEGRLVPKVKATDFQVEFGLHYSRPVQNDFASAKG